MTTGRVLAFDYGSRRIGVAVSDILRITAGPLEVIPTAGAMDHVRRLVEEYNPTVIVVGLPVALSGGEGPAAAAARRFGEDVRSATGAEIEFVDERFTTHTAEKAMLEGGVKRRDRRANVDKVAAAVILRQYLERQVPQRQVPERPDPERPDPERQSPEPRHPEPRRDPPTEGPS